jgi:hypothetical protein
MVTSAITGGLSFATFAFFDTGAFAWFTTGAGYQQLPRQFLPPLRAQQQLPRVRPQLPRALAQKKSFLPSPSPPLRAQQWPAPCILCHRRWRTNDCPGIFATAAGTAATADGASTTAPGVGAGKIFFAITFATSAGAATAALVMGKSAARAAMTTLHVGRGVAHIVQYLPLLLDETHAPHTQSEAEEEEAMGVSVWCWVWVVRVSGYDGLVVRVVWVGCLCCKLQAINTCCFASITRTSAPKHQQTTTAYWGSPESSWWDKPNYYI